MFSPCLLRVNSASSALTLVGLWLLRSPVLVDQISQGEPTTFSILPLLFPLRYICLALTSSQPEQSTKAKHHHRPSTLCCTPEESGEREGLLYGIFVEGKCPLSFPQPISSLFQTWSGALTEFSQAHRVNPSLSQLSPPHNVKSSWKEGSLFLVRLCGGGTLQKLDL